MEGMMKAGAMSAGAGVKRIGGVQKLTDNPHLNLYHIDAVDTGGRSFDYYFASRNEEKNLKLYTKALDPEGIVIYAVTREETPRLVMIREYRYPLDEEIYALPAGLVDAGETAGMAAVREMKEETGLDFEEYTGGEACFRKPFFMGPGLTDEASAAVFGTVKDAEGIQMCEASERIRVILADKEQVRRILREEKVSLRGAYLCMMFLQMDAGEPFRFLEAK